MNFSQALDLLKAGGEATRTGWNGKDMYVKLQLPEAHSKLTAPYLYLTAGSVVVPWVASQADVLGEDWAPAVHGPVQAPVHVITPFDPPAAAAEPEPMLAFVAEPQTLSVYSKPKKDKKASPWA